MEGKIVSISGFDGVGKSTQVEECLKYYEKKGEVISLFSVIKEEYYDTKEDLINLKKIFSNYDFIGTRFYLRSKNTRDLQKHVMFSNDLILQNDKKIKKLAMYAYEDCSNWFEYVVYPLLKKGKTFFFDRFFYDEVAYRSIYGVDIEWLESLYENFIRPDLAMYLELPLSRIVAINSEREDKDTTLFKHEDKLKQLEQVWQAVCDKYDINILNGNNNVSVINKQIIKLMDKLV